MLTVSAIKAFSDNYIWVLHDEAGHCVVVDPGQAEPVESWLRENNLTLDGILITHHHWDHTGGVAALSASRSIAVIGPDNPQIKGITRSVRDGEQFQLPGLKLDLQVLAVPGHTLDHIAFYSPEEQALFCGDTLFHCGCGRLFEGTPEQMHASLQKLAALPPDTRVYCTHEYTLANMDFALAVEPQNTALRAAQREAQQRRESDLATLPTSIAIQLECNPFLRCDQAAVASAAGQHAGDTAQSETAVFTSLRSWKDNF